jgi:predicted RNA-binding protein YlxR (DUF448 family)
MRGQKIRGRGPARTEPAEAPFHSLTIRLRNPARAELDRLVRLAKSKNAKPARERGRSAIIASLIQQADAEQQERSFAEGPGRPVSVSLPASVRDALTRLEARQGRSATKVIELMLARSAAERQQPSADEDLEEDEDDR